jgi:solute carrier family 25 (mitochondrial phosphate transporter), member 23/24/25/41
MPEGAEDLDIPLRLTAGAAAGMTSVLVTYPLDITRTRLSIQSSSLVLKPGEQPQKLPGMIPTLVKIWRTEGGFLALYRGLLPTLLGVAPYVGLNFAVYEHLRKMITPEGEKNPTHSGKLIVGGISGAIAQACTYPADVLRRRFQVTPRYIPTTVPNTLPSNINPTTNACPLEQS